MHSSKYDRVSTHNKKEENCFTINELVNKIWESVTNSSSKLNKHLKSKNGYPVETVTYTQGDPHVFSNIQGVGEVTTWSREYRGHGILQYSGNDEEQIKEYLSHLLGRNEKENPAIDVYGTILKDEEKGSCDYFIALHWREPMKNGNDTASKTIEPFLNKENSHIDVYLSVCKKGNDVFLNYFIVIPNNSLKEIRVLLPFPTITAEVNKHTSYSCDESEKTLWNIEKLETELGCQNIDGELKRKIKDYLEEQLNKEDMTDSLQELNPEWINVSFLYPCVSISSKIKMNGEETCLRRYVEVLRSFSSKFGKEFANSVANAFEQLKNEHEQEIRTKYV